MIEIKSKLRKWGNSFGIVIPNKSLKESKIKEGDEIVILIKEEENNILKKSFGTFKFKESTDKLMKEIDKELYDE